jgi:signal transduction histidine kinase
MEQLEAERALRLLVHDLRVPLSVANGYVRLLKENRLGAAEDRARAIEQTLGALGQIARICSDADALSSPPAAPATVVSDHARRFAERVRAACTSLGAEPLSFAIDLDGQRASLRTARADRLAEAVAVILCAARKSLRDRESTVCVGAVGNEVRFVLRSAAHPADDGGRVAFDPWKGGHGLALPLAARTVADAGGHVWSLPDGAGVDVTLPLETSAS